MQAAAEAAAARLLVGGVGQPNVGKSPVLNAIFNRTKVSVKETPGRTKTLQTLILDERTALFDSPGVVFPRLDLTREAQVSFALGPGAGEPECR